MDAQPVADVVRTRAWRRAAGGLLAATLFAFHPAILDMARVWATHADYSHGFLVPFVAAYLLWVRRDRLPPRVEWPDPIGLAPLLLGVTMSLAAGRTNYAKEFGQGLGLVLALTGCVVLLLGRRSLRWAWPGLAYLLFMVKLPDRLEVQFMFKLRQVATQASNFLLQTLGYPSYVGGPQGTIITVGDDRLGVEWACSGLSMVLTFVAVAAAFALLLNRPLGDRLFVLASALPIAVASNVVRITVTAIVYVAGWKQLVDLIVHDLAGYLMMPLALGFIWLELKLIDWLFVSPQGPSRDAVLQTATKAASAGWVVRDRAAEGTP